jgi:hypothetical protein
VSTRADERGGGRVVDKGGTQRVRSSGTISSGVLISREADGLPDRAVTR